MQDRHYKHWPKGVPKQFPLPETSLCYNLEVAATRYAARPRFSSTAASSATPS